MEAISEELSELYEKRKKISEQIYSKFGDGDFFEEDAIYQDLLMQFDCVNERINEIKSC
jgi:flagellar biosynthesis chaperone FliJ